MLFEKIYKLYKYRKAKKQLEKLNHKEINTFSFNGVEKFGRVVKVYDGDTCTLLFRWKKQNIKISCRLYGIDTPELRTKNKSEKKLAIEARDFLKILILEKIVFIEFFKNEKYGRPLVILYLKDGKSVNSLMIEKGYAKKYFGGKK